MNKLVSYKIWILLIIVIMLIGGVFILQKSSKISKKGTKRIKTTAEEIVGWKTYQDPKQEFLIKYPPSWKDPDEVGMNVYLYSGNDDVSIRTAGVFTPINPFKKWLSRIINQIKSYPGVSNFREEDIVFNNIPSVQLSYIDTKQNLIRIIVFMRKEESDKICEIGVKIRNRKDSYLPVVNQIFSTFKFLK